jgi:NTE family protein
MTIKHIVLSSGSYKGIYMLGVLKELNDIQYYSMDNIESIHAVSVGTIFAVLLSMRINMEYIIEYVVNRPWEKLFDATTVNIMNVMYSKGLFDINVFYSIFENFFKQEKIDKNITMKDFHEKYDVENTFLALNINTFENKIFSHKTTPNVPIIEAVYMSCSLPFIFAPIKYDGCFYIDGGLINPYPLKMCMEKYNHDEIMSIFIVDEDLKKNVTDNDNILTYGFFLFNTLIKKNRIKYKVEEFKNEILIPAPELNVQDAIQLIQHVENRKVAIKQGKNYAKLFMRYKLKHKNE